MKFESICVHGASKHQDQNGAIVPPVYQSATFAHRRVGETDGYDYSRLQNPTREHLERVVCDMEHGADAMAFSSGMAAITLAMELFEPGDQILAGDDLYGGTHRLFDHVSAKNHLAVDTVDTTSLEAVEAAVTDRTKAVFIETPSNPMMKVTDIAALAELTKRRGLLLFVDNTFLSPYLQNPIDLGADVVLHSGTKFLCGHNDALAGFLITADEELAQRYRFLYKTTGACLSAFDSFLLIQGIKTLPLRMEKQEENARQIVRWLQKRSEVTTVYYPGLPESQGYEINARQARGAGSMISFEVESKELAVRMLERVRLIYFAESLGGVETLMTYPSVQTHADIPEDVRNAKGITDRLLRISVGIEHIEDLIADLEQAMEGC
ncbi:MAG: PLP-dependent aspartate aminotransferase family protein [Clostridiales bacterium]|nr:PLP-dependent aspartate aminotransferase family protein [Clostridiales bacterium]